MSSDGRGFMRGGSKAREYFIIALLVIIIGGGVAAFGFYKDEVTAYVRLQGWNLSPVTQQTERFLEAASKGDGATVESMLAPSIPRVQPIKKNGKLTAFLFQVYGGTETLTLKQLVPDASVKPGKPKITPLEGGVVDIGIKYRPHLLELKWDLTPAGWRIVVMNVTKR
jgi:hypothetical protein